MNVVARVKDWFKFGAINCLIKMSQFASHPSVHRIWIHQQADHNGNTKKRPFDAFSSSSDCMLLWLLWLSSNSIRIRIRISP
jgi:hypothetical protein